MKTPEPQPVSTIALGEWREYRALKKKEAEKQREDRKKREAVIAKLRVKQRAHRRTALAALAPYGVAILNIGRHFLKIQQRKELQKLREKQPKREKALPCFATWMRGRYNRAMGLWRYRRRIKYDADMQQFEKPFAFPKIGEMESPYQAYRDVLLQQYQEYPDKIDTSQLDAMIALRMRLAGYSRGYIANEIGREAQALRGADEHRDWQNYARDTAYYAFSPAGDIDIVNYHFTPEKILAFHQEAERLEAERVGAVEAVQEAERMGEVEEAQEAERERPRPRMR
jgi:hypothetical protein